MEHYVMRRLINLIANVRVWGFAGIRSYARREINAVILRRKLAKSHEKSRNCRPERGITVIGDITERSGLSKTLRDFVLSLRDAGISVQTFDTAWKPSIPAADIADLVTPLEEFSLHRYSHIVMMYRSPLTKEMGRGHTVGRIVFHDSEHGIHSATPFLRESGDDIIGMSDFNYRYFARSFPGQNVWKIVYPFRFRLANATPREALRRKYGIGADDFAVFFNFDFGSYWRKNIPAALTAFALAFKGDKSAKLVFKTKAAWENRRREAEMMAKVEELGIGPQFIHIADYLPRADLDGLTGACDVYLSLHKSEGFGLGMAEAMSQGKPVVATNWSANTEYCHDDTAWCVPYSMVPILPYEYPVSMKEWASADPEAAAKMLRDVRANPQAAQRRALAGKEFMERHYSIANFKESVDAFLDGRVESGR